MLLVCPREVVNCVDRNPLAARRDDHRGIFYPRTPTSKIFPPNFSFQGDLPYECLVFACMITLCSEPFVGIIIVVLSIPALLSQRNIFSFNCRKYCCTNALPLQVCSSRVVGCVGTKKPSCHSSGSSSRCPLPPHPLKGGRVGHKGSSVAS